MESDIEGILSTSVGCYPWEKMAGCGFYLLKGYTRLQGQCAMSVHIIFTQPLCKIQTKIATSFGLTTSPYFSLKHCINKFSGDSAPKSIPSSVVLTAIACDSACVAFLSSSLR